MSWKKTPQNKDNRPKQTSEFSRTDSVLVSVNLGYHHGSQWEFSGETNLSEDIID